MKTKLLQSSRGSVLIVAMIFGAILAIALGSFLALNNHSLRMSNRSFYAIESVNMAESALDEVLWSFNQFNAGDAAAWDGWDRSSGVAATRTFTDWNLSANAIGTVRVYVDHYDPPVGIQPTAVARATVRMPDGQELTKTLEVKLKRRSLFAAGMVALNTINFNGNNASVDSWISDVDQNPATAAIPYSVGVRRDKGSIGAASGTATISIGNAEIWGTASVAGASTSAIGVGSNGRVA